MDEKHNKYVTIGKTYEIDQRAIKIFSSWLPDNWLPRKQDPDLFIDYTVEIVEHGEPTGKHFGVQIKGYEGAPDDLKSLSYSFKTKHLNYYFNRAQYPVFLVLINVTSTEGYWVFAQKTLMGQNMQNCLRKQKSLTVHFTTEDNLYNRAKFMALLPEAQTLVRELHPGSIKAAVQKRRAELESLDPRCSVTISIENGKEHITVIPKEEFTFTTKINIQDEEKWQNLLERGSTIKLRREEIEFSDAPLMQEALKSAEGDFEIKYGNETRGSIHVISKTESGKVIPIEGCFRSGTRYLNFLGQLIDSPLSITFEVSLDALSKAECFNLSILFLPKKWIGQPILNLAYFDQILSFENAFSGKLNPEMEIFIQGNTLLKGVLAYDDANLKDGMATILEWFSKCRWLALNFKVNPRLPSFEKIGRKEMALLERLYTFLTQMGTEIPAPDVEFGMITEKILTECIISSSDKNLRIDKPEQKVNFLGVDVVIPPTRHIFTDVEFVSQTPLENGTVSVKLAGTKNTIRTSQFI